MVLTRLSHVGEACPLSDLPPEGCPLRDHSYSDASVPSGSRQFNMPIPRSSSRPSTSDTYLYSTSQTSYRPLNILDLPNEILENIFSYLPFKSIGECRIVCVRFNEVGSAMLNSTFSKLLNQISNRYQATKAQMPRRESARRKHPLAREIDILETLEMRLALLQMTFGKHIERNYCCFFAGQILDEIFYILSFMKSPTHKIKVCKVIDELFDLSTMAMEYFKEALEPNLPEVSYLATELSNIAHLSEAEEDPDIESPPSSNMVLRKRIRKIRQGMKKYNTELATMKRELKACKSKMNDQHKQIIEYVKKIEQNDQKFEESSRKFAIILQELNKCKTELQHWRSRSPVHQMLCSGCGTRIRETPRSFDMNQQCLPSSSSSVKKMDPPLVFDSSLFNATKKLEFDFRKEPETSTTKKEFSIETIKKDPGLFDFFSKKESPFASSSKKEPVFDMSKKESLFDSTSSVLDLKRHFSSDDDSDMETDTVGKRVKERKRIRLEIH